MSLLELEQVIQPQRALRTSIVTLSTSAVTFVPLLDMRGRFFLQNTSSVTIAIGGTSSLSMSNGWLLGPSNDIVLPVGRDVIIFGIAGSTVQVIQMELI